MANILASAEPYGFGPSSKLRAVTRAVTRNGHAVDFVGQGLAADYAAGERDSFRGLTRVAAMTELADRPRGDHDAVLSVMDPHLAAWAQVVGLPCLYVDSLYWFWQWDAGLEPLVGQWRQRCAAGAPVAALAWFDAQPMMAQQYLAHSGNTVTCAQRAPSVDGPRTQPHLGPMELVDAIVDTGYLAPRPPATWLACLSGLVNPLTPLAAATSWLDSTLQLIDEAAVRAGLGDTPVTLTGNAGVLGSVDLPPRFATRPRSHADVLAAFNDAHVCLTPPGLTTMFEAVAYGVPLILLPEQHYGHLKIFGEFTGADPDAFPNGLVGLRTQRELGPDVAAATLGLIADLAARAAARDAVWDGMVDGVAAGLRSAGEDRAAFTAAQRAAVKRFASGFDGAAQSAAVLDDLLAAKYS